MVNHAITGVDIVAHSVMSLVTDCTSAFGYSIARSIKMAKKMTNSTTLNTNMIVDSTHSPRNYVSMPS